MQNLAPIDEQAFRLTRKSLFSFLDRDSEERFDRLTRLARRLLKVPMAILVMSDAGQQWIKSIDSQNVGHLGEVLAYCECAQKSRKTVQISDEQGGARLAKKSAGSEDSGYSFFASVPISYGMECSVAVFCIADCESRVLDADDLALFNELGRLLELEMLSTDQAQTDLLTGLPNRRGFESQACRVMRQATQQSRSIGLMYFDIDGMGDMNRLLGKSVADQALRSFGNALRVVTGVGQFWDDWVEMNSRYSPWTWIAKTSKLSLFGFAPTWRARAAARVWPARCASVLGSPSRTRMRRILRSMDFCTQPTMSCIEAKETCSIVASRLRLHAGIVRA